VHAFIIEDDELISQSIQDMLSDLGFAQFSFARSEEAAISGASGREFDLITADSRLLPGDGVKAVEVICKYRKIPVIFVTGYSDELKDRLGSRFNDPAIVTKPIQQDELAAAVHKVLGKRLR
jgi:DNA-binding response OmpR family regulator